MDAYCAVLLDAVGIQKYVFASNVLRDNIGASSIIKNLFGELAVPALMEACNLKEERVRKIMAEWEQQPDEILMENDPSVPFEYGVAGGGKALIFFRTYDYARSFIKSFTRDLLVKAPGLQLAVAIDKEFIPNEEFSKQLSFLYEQLTINRNNFFPVATLPTHGITAVCPNTGMSLDIYNPIDKSYISSATAAKKLAADNEEKEFQRKLTQKHPSYFFTSRVDKLGQTEGESHIAVVHIDGNNMGKWFKKSKDLVDYRHRSLRLAQITEECFWDLLNIIIEKEPYFKEQGSGFNIKPDGKYVVPIRPLILGGDDFTFVCEGRLGLYLAEAFIKIWVEKANSKLSSFGKPDNNGEFSACAGIAITKTKYPFYRAYEYSEQLCSNAKSFFREIQKGSWIDFHIVIGNRSGSIKDIRNEDRNSKGIQLYFGPYCVDQEKQLGERHPKSLQNLKEGIMAFVNSEYWSRSRIKDLRTAFYLGPEVLATFLTDMKAAGGELPHSGSFVYMTDFSEKGVVDACTPYNDMLEIMEYYPSFLLKGESKC